MPEPLRRRCEFVSLASHARSQLHCLHPWGALGLKGSARNPATSFSHMKRT
jgi:hypothetical protein